MQSSVILKASGLVTQPNQLSLPEGSLSEATNVIIRRDNVIESRRGFKLFGTTFGDVLSRLKQLLSYKDRLFRHYSDVLEFDSGTTNNAGEEVFLPFSGSILEAQEGLRIKSVESNGNFYFTTSEGIKKISALNASQFTTNAGYITLAGGIKALDLNGSLALTLGNQTGFLPQDSTVAYRVVWGTRDANNNLILGTPSPRLEIYNPLNSLLILDFNNLVQQIQNIANTGGPDISLIDDADYVSTLSLPQNATSLQINSNLVALATKIDKDILLVSDTLSTPMLITAVTVTDNPADNVCTITVSGQDPNDYLIVGSQIYLNNFQNPESGSLNGAQVVSALTSTTISFVTQAKGNEKLFIPTDVDVPNNKIIITSHGFVNKDPVRFSSTGSLPGGLFPGTTYYVGSVTANDFQVYSDATLATLVTLIDGGSGTHTIDFWMDVTGATVESGTYRFITLPTVPTVPGTDADLVSNQNYMQEIINALKESFTTGTPPTISSYSLTTFITPINLTTTANVNLQITVPPEVTLSYFYQIYRSATLQATETAVLSDLIPSDEMQLVYEAFPTQAEIDAGQINIQDSTPDAFRGANLYTNESSGEGLANQNDIPPFALDINRFKNVVFYANTRTKYRALLSLIGVTQMIEDYNNSITPTITISDGIFTNIYSFVVGVNQETDITTVADVADSLNGKYFLINSANNNNLYYVWYKTSGGVETDPMVAGRTGVEVFINTGDANTVVAQKTSDAINTLLVENFASSVASATITIVNSMAGYTDDAAAGTSGFTITTTTSGVGEKVSAQSDQFTTVADVAGSLAGKYFTINGAHDDNQYYVWYRVSNVGADPMVANRVGFVVDIATNDSANTVAQKTSDAINTLEFKFTSTFSTNTFIVTSYTYGQTDSPTVGTSGFSLTNISEGFLQVLLSASISPATAIDETARSFVHVINENKGETVFGFYLSGAGSVPGKMLIESRQLNTPQFYIVANNSNTGLSFNPNLSPKIAITSITAGLPLANIITTASPHGLQTGDQVFLVNTDTLPNLDGLHTITLLSSTTFTLNETVYTNGTQGDMIAASQAFAGTNDARVNRIYYSKFQEPEAVPIGNYFDVGAADKAILRIYPLRDSLFVFKEDGLYRISGEVSPFNLALFDSTCTLTAPDSVSAVNNLVFAWTTEGIVTVTESGVSTPLSRPIDNEILKIGSNSYPSFKTATWGVGYQSDNSYIAYAPKESTDDLATIAYRFSTLTNTWTTWDKTDTCGIVGSADDLLYLGAGDINSIEQERKNFNRSDYADRQFDVDLIDGRYVGVSLKLSDVTNINPGDVLVQNQLLTIFDYNSLLQKLDIDPSLYVADISSITIGMNPTITTSTNHLFSTGDMIRISNSNTTPNIDGLYQVTVLNATQFEITLTKNILSPGTSGQAKYMYFETLGIDSGANLRNAIVALSNRLTIEPNLIYAYQTGSIVSNSVANPTVVTVSAPHNLGVTGTSRKLNISGVVGSSPSINGNQTVTIIDSTSFSINLNVTIAGAGGIFSTIDDYVTAIATKNGIITNISVANPTVLTSVDHGLINGRYIQLSGTDSDPIINGNYSITYINEDTFSVPIQVLTAGTTGNFGTIVSSFQDIQTCYNYIINLLNLDEGVSYSNYKIIDDTTDQEVVVLSVNKSVKELIINHALQLVVGPLTVYKSIATSFTYSPETFQDPLSLKQISEATLMFDNKAFTRASLSFASDLKPKFNEIIFNGDGNGIFGIGNGPFGTKYFGGNSNSAPFRTYIPRDNQRCRYLIAKFSHRIARERYAINGLTLTGNMGESSRAYR